MQMAEKKWQKPEMIVLVRNKPEEAVLDFCKGAGPTIEGPAKDGCGDGYPPWCLDLNPS